MIPKQTANFPGFRQPERSWENNLRALTSQTLPQGILKGLALGIPTSGATPTLTDGYLVDGDRILGPFGSKLVGPAPRNVYRRGLYYGLEGMFYATPEQAQLPAIPLYQAGDTAQRAWLIGEVTTSDTESPDVIHVAQYLSLSTDRIGIRSLFKPGSLGAGVDVVIASAKLPTGFQNARIAFATHRNKTALTAVTATSDTALVKYKADALSAATLITVSNANLAAAAGSLVAAANIIYLPNSTQTVDVIYALTDADASIVSGVIEVNVVIELF